jgi:hypothetical protein
MIYRCKLTVLFLIGIFLSACSEQDPSEPSCRVNAAFASNHKGAGACVVRMNNKLLVTQLTSGLYDLPSKRYGLSDSMSSNVSIIKSAQCLAHQAMWQQTGLNVEVQAVIGAQADGTWIFACHINAGFNGTEAPFSPPYWSNSNIQNIAFINPFEIELQDWARQKHFTVVRDAYVLAGIHQNNP